MRTRRRILLLAVVLLVAAGALTAWLWRSALQPTRVVQGQALYQKNCAVCHGLTGDGRGEAAFLLQPKPRSFRAGKFRLVTSQNLEPTREDVFQTITNGMPGTAMPSWLHLKESDRWSLADYVLKLNRDGWYEKGLALGYSAAEAEKYAQEMTEPGPPISVPPEPPPSPAGLREGRELYRTACANCHGEKGEGRRDPTWRTAEGFPTWSRNLRQGVFKAGRDSRQMYVMFSAGLPGTPMPRQNFKPEQTWRVVQYVQSLSDPAAQEQAQIRPQEIIAEKREKLPSAPDDAAWESAAEIRISLMPLWWNEHYIEAVRVKALHDGQRLAFRLQWDDSSRDLDAVRQQSFPDGAAVQLSASPNPPLFAMGAPGEPVNIWHWKAVWSEDRQQFQDVATAFPHMAVDSYYGSQKGWHSQPGDDTQFLPAQAVHNLLASSQRPSVIEDANAAGLGTLASQAAAKQSVEGVSRWKDGVWRLQLTRTIEAADRQDARLRAAAPASVAFAVWNGSAGDRDGQKSVSIWNPLRLE